jgi:ribosomal protein S4
MRSASHIRLSGVLNADLWGYMYNLRKNTRRIKRLMGIQRAWRPPKGYLSLSLNRGEEFIRPIKLRKKYSIHMRLRRRMRFFYGIRNERKFRKIIRSYHIRRGNMLELVMGCWETRVDMLLLRVGFVIYIHQASTLVKNKAIRINGELVLYCACRAKPKQIISFSKIAYKTVWSLKFLAQFRLLRKQPKYIYLSYRLMAFLLMRNPYIREVRYAFTKPGPLLFLRHY